MSIVIFEICYKSADIPLFFFLYSSSHFLQNNNNNYR